MSNNSNIKLVIVGDGAVGKTSLLTVLKGEPFPERYVPTIFDNYTQTVKYQNKDYQLHIWDTPGQDEFDRLRPLSYQDAKCILLCFALDKRSSFINLAERWVMEINYYCKEVKIILVGCKLDLRTESRDSVTDAEAQQFCKEHKFVSYISTSAKTGQGVDQIFPQVIDCSFQKKKACELI